jgi:hypothetical protein
LKLSPENRNKIIQQIENSKYFNLGHKPVEPVYQVVPHGYLTPKLYLDYPIPSGYCRETYQKLKAGYVSDYDIIYVSKTENKLTFQRLNQ